MVESIVGLFVKNGKEPKHLRMDNAGKNQKLSEACKAAGLKPKIKCEYTPCNIPQQNALVEIGCLTLSGCGKAMSSDANVPNDHYHILLLNALSNVPGIVRAV